jgi:peptidoglycan glycosyltransferase
MAEYVRRVGVVLILGFALVALDLAYWQFLAAPSLAGNLKYNATRIYAAEASTQRGRILDRNGVVLAESKATPDGYSRVYPYPALAGVVGYHDQVYGNSGIEDAFDAYLSGQAGTGMLDGLRNRLLHTPTVGADVVLSIDVRLQEAADAALGDGPGAVVVIEPKTGEVLAMASHPYFDPNTLARDWPKLKDADDHPLLNRATQGLYPPGSVFKTVTLAGSLDLGEYKPENKFTCNDRLLVEGFPIKCDPPATGTFDLGHAYAYSCNACFGEVGLRLGGRDLTDYARRFGFESAIPLEVPTVPSQIAASDPEKRLVGPLLASTGFGQGELLATPLQMALVSATIADGGVAPTPHLVLDVRRTGGEVIYRTPARPWRTAVRSETARTVAGMMVLGVDEGLASSAKIQGVKVAGKTGTAEVGPGQNTHAWFIGYAPADNPTVAIALVKEHGGGGGTVATPLARTVMETALHSPR